MGTGGGGLGAAGPVVLVSGVLSCLRWIVRGVTGRRRISGSLLGSITHLCAVHWTGKVYLVLIFSFEY